MMDRRSFLTVIGASVATASMASAGVAHAQGQMQNMANMDHGAHKPVRLPPKPGAQPVLSDAQRDELERHLHCQCGCGLDVFICRTTDFSCSVSPAMHRDVMSLVAGGYNADEIVAAFRKVYGEKVLMAPTKEGFNWVGWILPFVAIAAGGGVVVTLIKRWSRPAASATGITSAEKVEATPDELKRLNELLKDDDA